MWGRSGAWEKRGERWLFRSDGTQEVIYWKRGEGRIEKGESVKDHTWESSVFRFPLTPSTTEGLRRSSVIHFHLVSNRAAGICT